jgi:hypothetical protein
VATTVQCPVHRGDVLIASTIIRTRADRCVGGLAIPVISSGNMESRTSRSSFCSSTPMVTNDYGIAARLIGNGHNKAAEERISHPLAKTDKEIRCKDVRVSKKQAPTPTLGFSPTNRKPQWRRDQPHHLFWIALRSVSSPSPRHGLSPRAANKPSPVTIQSGRRE